MNFHAVVGMDRWSNAEYRAAVGRALTMNGGKVLLRLEPEDLEDIVCRSIRLIQEADTRSGTRVLEDLSDDRCHVMA
jgi:hypothetical protein